jgi:hypothetical protein
MINKTTSILFYLKYPTIPFYDYYKDVNGRYHYLEAGETHSWVEGEVDSNGREKLGTESLYTSQTVEMNWKNEDKIIIAQRILATLGVRVNEKQLFEHAYTAKTESL